MTHLYTFIALQKPIKVGPRRCVFRRWEAHIEGFNIITHTFQVERMYRGNTPYRVGAKIVRTFKSTSHAGAKIVLDRLRSRRVKTGYKKT